MERRRIRSLAEISPDQTVTVRRILFDCLREWCGELGLHEGDLLSLGRRDGGAVVVRKRDGVVVQCPCELARFVEIEGARKG